MKRTGRTRSARIAAALGLGAVVLAGAAAAAQQQRQLHDGWRLQSSASAGADGAAISSPTYDAAHWYRASAPSTVVGALVTDGVYRDPFFGMNLRTLPGMTYPIGANFVHTAMDASSPFAVPWWYRTTFATPAGARGRHVTLRFDGINYRANVWLNGHRIADSAQIAGTYRRYELDVTHLLARRGANVLAVEIWAPTTPDLQTTWVDWNPSPPDKDMGLWQPVWLATSGDVVVRSPVLETRVDTATLASADVTVGAELRNLSSSPVAGTLRGRLGAVAFSRGVTLAPHETTLVEIGPDSAPQLHLAHPRLWWPAQLGRPSLTDLDLSFDEHGAVSDRLHTRVGIREITSEMTPTGARLFRVNGKRILVLGGGWAPDMFFRPQPQRQLDQLRYVLDLHLNAVRLEGNYENDHFWHLTDSLGVLVMSGWVCCDPWEEWPKWGPEQYAVSAASLRDQIRRLREHPSALVWLNGSDNPPPAAVEQTYLAVERDEHWPNPTTSSASAKPTTVTGNSGVKMTGPYDWVPPSYWMQDSTHGGAWGYNTETSPGAAVPPMETMRRMMAAHDTAWPIDSVWLYHAAGGQFTHLLDRFNTAMRERYGAPTSSEDYTNTSQLMTYEGERAMFEAYRRNKYRSTGLIQWMLNNAWPGIYWHLFDWYLTPAGGYFGAKKANEPVHVLYSYDDNSVAIVNGTRAPVRGAHLRARLYRVDGTLLSTRDATIDLPADSSIRPFTLTEPAGVAGAYFADLRLTSASGTPLSTNFYWLSTHPDVLADTSTWYMTPVKQYADYTALRQMPAARVRSTVATDAVSGGMRSTRVTLSNPGKTIAFFVHARVVGADGLDVAPVFWSDDYVSLLPGETRVLTVRYAARQAHIVVNWWNAPGAGGAR